MLSEALTLKLCAPAIWQGYWIYACLKCHAPLIYERGEYHFSCSCHADKKPLVIRKDEK